MTCVVVDVVAVGGGGGEATTACVLRCLKPWFRTNATAIGDSWFASVQTAVALRSNGPNFIGNAKTATKYYPKRALAAKLDDTPRGTSVYMKTTVAAGEFPIGEDPDEHAANGTELYAEGWNDNHRKTYIATSGKIEKSTDQAGVRRQDKHGNTYIRHHARAVLTQAYHSGSHSIDDHNNTTQNHIGLEYLWDTADPWKRCICCLLESIAADAHYAYRYVDPARKHIKIADNIRTLGAQLINNRWLEEENAAVGDVPAANALDQLDSNSSFKLVEIPACADGKRKQMKCQMGCKNGKGEPYKTQWLCRRCGVYCCRPGARDCYARHERGEAEVSKSRKRQAATQGGRVNPTPFRMSGSGASAASGGSSGR